MGMKESERNEVREAEMREERRNQEEEEGK